MTKSEQIIKQDIEGYAKKHGLILDNNNLFNNKEEFSTEGKIYFWQTKTGLEIQDRRNRPYCYTVSLELYEQRTVYYCLPDDKPFNTFDLLMDYVIKQKH